MLGSTAPLTHGSGLQAMASRQRPEQIAPADHLADLRLHAAESLHAGGARRLHKQAGNEIELDRKPRAPLEGEAIDKARSWIERL